MQSMSIDASHDDRVIIRRDGLDGASTEEAGQVLRDKNLTLWSNNFYAIEPGRRVDEVVGQVDSPDERAFLQNEIKLDRNVRGTPIDANHLSLIQSEWSPPIAGDGPEQLGAPLLIGTLMMEHPNVYRLRATPLIRGRFHTFNPLAASGVEFDKNVPQEHRDYLHQIADIVNDGGAGLVNFISAAAFKAPALEVVLDLQAVRMLAGQIGLRMAQHISDGGSVGELMTSRESAIRRAALEFILLNEIGAAELRVVGEDAYAIVSDVIRSVSHSAAEADAYLASHVRQGLAAADDQDAGQDETDEDETGATEQRQQGARAVVGPQPGNDASEAPEAYDPEAYEAVMAELDSLVGLAAVKAEAQVLKSLADFQGDRILQGHAQDDVSLHLVFTGNPGTGKTTVARMVGRIYRSLGLLKKGHVVEVGRSDLVATYIGQTEEKVQAVIDKAMDGVLFIDEAYALAVPQSPNDYGKQAIEVLLTKMENHADRLAVIAAGYTKEMKTFIDANPGLQSRFELNKPFLFEDYNGEELTEIYRRMAVARRYRMSDEVLAAVRERYDRLYEERDRNFGNGRMVRNDFQRTVKRLASRHVRGTPVDLEIRLEDIQSI
jgi:hypothetical protein